MPSVFIDGFRGVGQQCDRIEAGFRQLGWTVTPHVSEASLVYGNDSGVYESLLMDRVCGVIRGKLILNVLDLAPHLGAAFPLARVKAQLAQADAVTCISRFVQQDLKARAGIDAPIVYAPIRAITRTGVRKHAYRALFVGRVSDPWKRTMIAASALSILGFGYDDMVTVGREPPPYGGVYWGTASDETLNDLYNSVDYVMFPSGGSEGMGLPPLEAMAAGAIPVVCNDLCTRAEFLPSEAFPEYDDTHADAPSIARFMARFMQDNDAKEAFKERLHVHYRAQWERKLSPAGVAQAIANVYETL